MVIADVRPVDGAGSNEENEDWGATGQELFRLAEANYEDGVGQPVEGLPNAREISNAIVAQEGSFSAAAKRLNLSAPYISQMIADLELRMSGRHSGGL